MAEQRSLLDLSGNQEPALHIPPPLPGRLGRLMHYLPAIDSLRSYSWQALGGDLTAGLTVATIAVPQAMAYAILAGVRPEYGLYTAIVMTAVGAFFDSSRQLINGPTNAISIALLSALAVIPEGDRVQAAVLLAFLVGLVQMGIALMRLGDLTRYVSHSVIIGFTVGAGFLLVLDQLKNFLGLEARGAAEDHFLKRFWLTIQNGHINWPTLLIGLATIAVVVAVRRFNGYCRSRGARFPIPQHLVAVVLMATVVWACQLDDPPYGVKIVGDIPAKLPHFQTPELKWEQVRLLSGNAFAIAILGLLEAVAMAKSIAGRTGQTLDINQQCLSEGAANLAGSFFQCIPGSGSLTRSAVNQQAGAVTQWSGVVAAVAVAAMVLLFAQYARYIPKASLAGLLMLAAFRMVDRAQLAFHLRATRFDAGVVLVTAFAAVAISVEFCIVIGVFLSFVLYVPRAARIRLTPLVPTGDDRLRERQPTDPLCDHIQIYHLEGELFFGVEPELKHHLTEIDQTARGKVRAVILILDRARNPDAAFLSLLKTLENQLRKREVALILCGVTADLSKALVSTGLEAQIGRERIFADSRDHAVSRRAAVQCAYDILGEERCSTCPRRTNGAAANPWWDYVI